MKASIFQSNNSMAKSMNYLSDKWTPLKQDIVPF